MVILSPIIRLDTKETFEVFRTCEVNIITVRFQDLVLKRTFGLNKTYNDIVSSGGLHNFLDFNGEIILSLIMRDQIIANLGPNEYSSVIDNLNPDYFTTIDGETYEDEYSLSMREIKRIDRENKELLKLSPRSKPIGLVKGCSVDQIELHISLLKKLNITDFMFHVGDFFRQGDPNMIKKAKSYSGRVRKHANRLFLYGMGSQKRLIEFSFADVFVSFKHFVTARNGMMFIGTQKIKYNGPYNSKILLKNFSEMHNNVRMLDRQARLF